MIFVNDIIALEVTYRWLDLPVSTSNLDQGGKGLFLALKTIYFIKTIFLVAGSETVSRQAW